MLGVLISSLTTTSPLPAISDKTSTSGFLVASNQLLGGDSNKPFKANEHNEKNRQSMPRRFSDVRQRLKRVCPLAATREEETRDDAAGEDRGATVGEEACIAGAAEEEVIGSCSIVERAVMKVF